MKKILKWIPKTGLPIVLFVLLACVFFYAITFSMKADDIGDSLGETIGLATGKAVGSFDGFTTGRKEGMEAGEKTGLSAIDTKVDLENEIKSVSNLEVLVASVKVSDIHAIGEENTYKALYLLKGEVVFSVDLSKSRVDINDDVLQISLPEPTGQLFISDDQIEKVAEYQKHFFTGSTEAGFDAYLNSMAKVQAATAETLDNYELLIESAKVSAEKQIKQLIGAVRKTDKKVQITFLEGE